MKKSLEKHTGSLIVHEMNLIQTPWEFSLFDFLREIRVA